MKTLMLIRHSLTEGNERRLYYGWTDIPLTENGRRLCAERRDTYELPEGTTFAHTGMVRTEQTLRLMFGAVPARVLPELKEMDMGMLEMRGYEDVKEEPAFRAWCDDTTGDMPIPGGTESSNSFRDRIMRGLRRLMTDDSADALMLVCHGGTIGHAMQVLFPQEGKHMYEWIPQACEGYSLTLNGGEAVAYSKLPSDGRKG